MDCYTYLISCSVEGNYPVLCQAHDEVWHITPHTINVHSVNCCKWWTEPYGGGSGTPSDPYLICSTAQFEAIQQNLASHFIVTQDLDFSSKDFTPIGSTASPFGGTLDGNGKSLQHITYSSPGDADHVGIFRATGPGAVIHDLKLETLSLTGNEITGALIGKANGSRIHHITGSQINVQTKAMGGGLIGYFVGDADTGNEDIADIALDHVTVKSSATGTSIGRTFDTGVGSIAGRMAGVGTTTRTHVTNANITWDPAGTNISGWTHVGGIVGYSGSGGLQLVASSFQGTVTGGVADVGGIVGQYDGNTEGPGYVEDVRVTSTTVTGRHYVGGLAGIWNRAVRTGSLPTLRRTVFEGTVNALGDAGSAGGITGILLSGALHQQVSVKATVNGKNNLGGLYGLTGSSYALEDLAFTGIVNSEGGDHVGLITGRTTVTPWPLVYNRIFVSGSINNQNSSAGTTHVDVGSAPHGNFQNTFYRFSTAAGLGTLHATGLTDSELTDSSKFLSFDFSNIWALPTSNGWTGVVSPALRFQCGQDAIACPP